MRNTSVGPVWGSIKLSEVSAATINNNFSCTNGKAKSTQRRKKIGQVFFRLTETERSQLLQLARTCDCAPGNLIRNKLFTGRFPTPKAAQIDIGVYAELKKIGVNVNQLAKQVNSGTVLTAVPAILNKLLRQQDKIINLLIRDRDPENR